jgi:hypothetical protein
LPSIPLLFFEAGCGDGAAEITIGWEFGVARKDAI